MHCFNEPLDLFDLHVTDLISVCFRKFRLPNWMSCKPIEIYFIIKLSGVSVLYSLGTFIYMKAFYYSLLMVHYFHNASFMFYQALFAYFIFQMINFVLSSLLYLLYVYQAFSYVHIYF